MRPVLVTFDVLRRDPSQPSALLVLLPQLDEVVDALMDEVAVVLQGGVALHGPGDGVQALLQELLEVLLLQPQHVLTLGALLEISLDHGPEGLDRVQFGGVRGHKHELEVELPRHLPVHERLVRRVVVEHEVGAVDRLQCAAQLDQEVLEGLAISALLEREDRTIKARADGAYHSHAAAAVLAEQDPNRPARACPRVRLLQPQVEGGLVDVHEDLIPVP